MSPGAKVWHAEIVRRLRERLGTLERQGFLIGNDFSCILKPRSMPVPDLAVVSGERWNATAQLDA